MGKILRRVLVALTLTLVVLLGRDISPAAAYVQYCGHDAKVYQYGQSQVIVSFVSSYDVFNRDTATFIHHHITRQATYVASFNPGNPGGGMGSTKVSDNKYDVTCGTQPDGK